MKKCILLLALLSTSLLFAQNSAFVSQDSILASIPKYKENVTKIDSLKKAYQEEIKGAKEKINQNLQQLLAGSNVLENEDIETIKKRMNANDLSKLELLIEEDKFIDKKVKNYDMLLTSEYNTLVQPILDKVNTAIFNYATKNKLDLVCILEQIRPALAYLDKKKDVTTVIIESLKEKE